MASPAATLGARWRPIMLSAGLAVVLGVGFAVSAHLLGARPGTSADRGDEIAVESRDLSVVMGVLRAHARALLARDRSGWQQGLDATAKSAEFAEQQRAVFDNLAGVPLSTWSYSFVSIETRPEVVSHAARRLGAPVVVLHLRLRYALAEVDPAPTAKDLWTTVVRRGTSWKLAGDDDASVAGGLSWRGPWDFGPLKVARTPHTLVLSHPAHAADLVPLANLVEQSVPVVQSVWGADWNDHIAVLIPDTDNEFAEIAGDIGDAHNLAALAVADEVAPGGVVLGARIVMNPRNLSRLDAAGRQLVLRHEMTHLATRASTPTEMPPWVVEGFADFVGNLGSDRPVSDLAAELAGEVREGHLPTALPTPAEFDGANVRLAQVYEEAWTACRLIALRVGVPGLARFYRAVSSAAKSDPATSVRLGLQQVLTIDTAGFTRVWRTQLQAELH